MLCLLHRVRAVSDGELEGCDASVRELWGSFSHVEEEWEYACSSAGLRECEVFVCDL